MVMEADGATPVDGRTERYRQAEQALWGHYGLKPTERFIELDSPRVRLRVVEVGSGEPVLFVPGTAGTGPYWGPLVRELKGFRCLMLDRPGWGLSSPVRLFEIRVPGWISQRDRRPRSRLGRSSTMASAIRGRAAI